MRRRGDGIIGILHDSLHKILRDRHCSDRGSSGHQRPPGRPACTDPIGDKGKPFPLGRIVQEGPVAILSRSPPITKGDCEAIYRASERLAGDKVRLVVLDIGQQPCTAKPNVVLPTDAAQLATLFPPDASIREAWRLIVADPIGSVRVLKTLPVTPDGIARAIGMAATWEYGRQSFITNCGHCHGNDGADTSYTGIKSLAGVSRRLTG